MAVTANTLCNRDCANFRCRRNQFKKFMNSTYLKWAEFMETATWHHFPDCRVFKPLEDPDE